MATRGKAARTPAECDELLNEFLAAGDLDAIVDLYEPGATFITQDRAVKVGRDAIREAFTQFAAAKPRLTANIVLTARNGDNLAMLYNDWSMSVRTPGGGAKAGWRRRTRPSRLVVVPASSAHWALGKTTSANRAVSEGKKSATARKSSARRRSAT